MGWIEVETMFAETLTETLQNIDLFCHLATTSLDHPSVVRRFKIDDNRELKHARFWDADGKRKRTFHMPGQWCLPDIFVLIISNGEKILSNVNMIVWKTGLKRKQLTSGCRSPLKNVRA